MRKVGKPSSCMKSTGTNGSTTSFGSASIEAVPPFSTDAGITSEMVSLCAREYAGEGGTTNASVVGRTSST
eukprot:6070638-Prymnesium_polylepis.1